MKSLIARFAAVGQALLLAVACGPGSPAAPAEQRAPGGAPVAGTSRPISAPAPEPSPAPSPGASAAASAGRIDPPGLTDNRVTIGVISDRSLVYADPSGGEAVKAVQMAVEDFERRYGTGVLGGPIEVVGADLQNRPDLALVRGQEFYDRLGVDVILDVPTSSAALAIAGLARDKRRLFVNVTAPTTALTGAQCNRYTFHYAYDTWMLANGTGTEVTRREGRTWHILYPNYAYGQDMERSFQTAIRAAGGEVVGSEGTPFPNPGNDFLPFLLRARSLRPDILGTMNAGDELLSIVRQYNELKLKDQGVRLAVGLLFDSDVHALGADAVAGALYTTPWIWNLDAQSREWADRYAKVIGGGNRPTFAQAGNYSAATQYLEAVRRAGGDSADDVVKALEGQLINDFFIRNGRIRPEDHRVIGDKYLAAVKAQSQVREPWDYSRVLGTIPAEKAFRPVAESRAAGCEMP